MLRVVSNMLRVVRDSCPAALCSHMAVPWASAALVGSAVHTITPALGQAPSAGLETTALLDKVTAVHSC